MSDQKLLKLLEKGDEEKTISYLKRNPYLRNDALNIQGITAFMLACSRNAHSVTDYLIENGVDVHAKNMRGQNALYFACFEGDTRLIKKLHAVGLSFNEEKHELSLALIHAAKWNNFELVQLFIEMGADVNYELISKSGIRLESLIDVISGKFCTLDIHYFISILDQFNDENQKALKKLRLKQLVEKGIYK